MLSEDSKNKIEAMSKDELLQEINKGNRSRFQGEKFDYIKYCYENIKNQKQQEIRQEDIAHRTEELNLAREANQLSNKANKQSIFANVLSIIAIMVSIASAIIAIIALFL